MTILFIDAYDSFSNNIISLLSTYLDVDIKSAKIDYFSDYTDDDLAIFVSKFDAVVAGPGPGHPGNLRDVGLIDRLWRLPEWSTVPVLGICLGFQSLCFAHGGLVVPLKKPRHGIVTRITHNDESIFASAGQIDATQYHSLHVLLDDGGLSSCFIRPLAWDHSDSENGPILMAVEHISKPWYGIQFHPESICTDRAGANIVLYWWLEACRYNLHRTRPPQTPPEHCHQADDAERHTAKQLDRVIHSAVISGQCPAVEQIVETLRSHAPFEPILLQSGTRSGIPVNPETGRFSIVGIPDSASAQIRYSCETGMMSLSIGARLLLHEEHSIEHIFAFLEHFIETHKAKDGLPHIPFWGGLVGFVSYEASLKTIDVDPPSQSEHRPDLWFVFIERSVIIDHVLNEVIVQTIREEDEDWFGCVQDLLRSLNVSPPDTGPRKETRGQPVSVPAKQTYCNQVLHCQQYLHEGSSYELCLTDQTIVQSQASPWDLFTNLSHHNPAPFAAYLRLSCRVGYQSGLSVVGSSPERFLSWSREGLCQFRPIKGTVSKANGMTRQAAEKILNSPKERAENLMIVDLIRHDLAGTHGMGEVLVKSLMSVEEYETVYQLVSVIEGQLSPTYNGISVLANSLPPGSMTGAPKRRSCELLKEIERHQPRGLYSGVIGYMDVGGGGDFSVVIRTAFRWDDEDVWRIGAGGAVTVLSTPEGEYEEMTVKRERLMKIFSS